MAQAEESMRSQSLIRVRGLRVRYHQQEVLHGVNLDLNDGEFVSLVGKSGCGKSTLLHALAGFVPYQGEVKMPDSLGMVFQNYAIFPWLTVRGNIAFGLGKNHRGDRDEAISNILNMLGIEAEASSYPSELSGGQAQRVALGRAIAADPDVIFMDEPFGALDLFTREKMQTWLLEVWEQQHKTVLFVTHSIEEAIYLSDRILVLADGVVVAEFEVPFGRPRLEDMKFDKAFVSLKRELLTCMEGPAESLRSDALGRRISEG